MKRRLIIDCDMVVHPVTQTCRQEIDWDQDTTTITIDLEAARGQILSQVSEWELELDCDPGTSILCFSSKTNWRKGLCDTYKAHRKGPKPPGFKKLVEWCCRTWDYRIWEDLEADDVCGILTTQLTPCPPEERWILVSGDKDMQTVPGYQWDFNRDVVGQVRFNSPLEADRFHLKQALMGDRTDGYPGCPGIGPKSADKLLDGLGTSEEMWEAVVAAYEKKGLGEAEALENARLAYILRDGDYDLEKQEVKLWEAPTSSKRAA